MFNQQDKLRIATNISSSYILTYPFTSWAFAHIYLPGMFTKISKAFLFSSAGFLLPKDPSTMFLSQINSKARRTFKHFFHKKAIDFLSNYKLDRPIPIICFSKKKSTDRLTEMTTCSHVSSVVRNCKIDASKASFSRTRLASAIYD